MHTRFQLIQRDDCPLCDEALFILAQAQMPEFDSIWIEDDAELESRFGLHVPVLYDSVSGESLNWPFHAQQVTTWLAELE